MTELDIHIIPLIQDTQRQGYGRKKQYGFYGTQICSVGHEKNECMAAQVGLVLARIPGCLVHNLVGQIGKHPSPRHLEKL